jgi:hypothetical protein
MYTGMIENLEDAEVAINVWMVSSALFVRDLPDYVYKKIGEALPGTPLRILPGVVRQALSSWSLAQSLGPGPQEQGANILHSVMELLMCKMQVCTDKGHLIQCFLLPARPHLRKTLEDRPATRLRILPGVVRLALGAWSLAQTLGLGQQEQGERQHPSLSHGAARVKDAGAQ